MKKKVMISVMVAAALGAAVVAQAAPAGMGFADKKAAIEACAGTASETVGTEITGETCDADALIAAADTAGTAVASYDYTAQIDGTIQYVNDTVKAQEEAAAKAAAEKAAAEKAAAEKAAAQSSSGSTSTNSGTSSSSGSTASAASTTTTAAASTSAGTSSVASEKASRAGMIGRLSIPSAGMTPVAVFNSFTQGTVDKKDSAAAVSMGDWVIIADHVNQNFSALKYVGVGTVAYLDCGDVTYTLQCIDYNATFASNSNDAGCFTSAFSNSVSGCVVTYTCNGWPTVRCALWAPVGCSISDITSRL